ncbi:MAG: tRNA 2-thiouridine(34) synthase MnmA [Solirubrobacterales bacterium]|nr:tRNA 2-thiouridine(34) synthase MnmA [Solirubrobacterales bacterium]
MTGYKAGVVPAGRSPPNLSGMTQEAIEHYLADRSRRAPEPADAVSGAAGGAPCGDLVRISLRADAGSIAEASWESEGCAATAAAAAALAELVEGATVLDAARVGPADVSEALGGLAPTHAHAAELTADALHRALSRLASSQTVLAESAPGRVLVALSGGVDSAAAAHMLRERRSEVVAVTLKLWADARTDGEKSCCSPEAVLRARRLAHGMGLPHLTLDLREPFKAAVVDEFVAGYEAGRTPNPCVRCNGELRIDAMVELADRLGAEALATGHYARIENDGTGPLLVAPADAAKDQTYMLAALRPATLSRLRFPLAELTKPEVRRLASAAGLEVAERRDSQDLCFLAGRGKREFLRTHGSVRDAEGEIRDAGGRRLGTHHGYQHFTVGQRRGIGVSSPQPLYVLATDAERNVVTVGPREQLARTSVAVRDAVLHRGAVEVDAVRLRYHSAALPASVAGSPSAGRHPSLELELDRPAYAVAPGQAAVLLSGDAVVGHATIV